MVGLRPLKASILVRVQVRQPGFFCYNLPIWKIVMCITNFRVICAVIVAVQPQIGSARNAMLSL